MEKRKRQYSLSVGEGGEGQNSPTLYTRFRHRICRRTRQLRASNSRAQAKPTSPYLWLHPDFVGFDVRFYNAEDDGAKPKPFLFKLRPFLPDFGRPLKFVAENDQYYTRVKRACAAYIRFRVFDCVRGEYERGECWASGSIKAKQILDNGESAMSTVFESSGSGAVKFMGPSIPLLRPVLVVPVQMEEVEEIKAWRLGTA